jgi:hypothetical protein
MTNLNELKELVEFMRANGVVQCGDVVLDPTFQSGPVDKLTRAKKVLVKEGILGADGLTAEEQLEIHNRIIDAIPPVYREE